MNESEAIERIPETRELPTEAVEKIKQDTEQGLLPALYTGAAMVKFEPDQRAVLEQTISLDDYDIKPTGEVYLSQIRYRRILNDAFGPGAWALVPMGKLQKLGNTVCKEYALLVNGRFISEAIGEADFIPTNANMTMATSAESAKSNALMRCCKDLGIKGADLCWDRRWTEKFKDDHCIQVWVNKKDKPQWRRKDSKPFYGETGVVNDKGPAKVVDAKPVAPATSPGARPAGISQAQLGRLFGIAKSNGISEDDLHQYAEGNWNLKSLSQLNRQQYDDICAWADKKTEV